MNFKKLKLKLAKFLAGKDYAVIPVKASEALLNSMAMRENHAFYAPNMFKSDKEILEARKSSDFSIKLMAHQALTEQERKNSLNTMRQLHEEVVGRGFHTYE